MRNILKQSSWLVVAQALTRVISFFYIIFLARSLGVSDFGLYTVALAYFSIISSIADFGFNRFLIREVSREKSKAEELLWNVVVVRLTLTTVLFAVFSVALYLFDPDKTRVSLILLATLAILPQSVAFTFDAIFIALQKLQFSAIALFLASLINALFGFYLVNNGFGPMGAINALIISQTIYAVILIVLLIKNVGFILSSVKLSIIKRAISGSLPYGLLGILGLLYFRIDTIILSYLKGSLETGIYGVAYKFLEAVIFIPSAFSLALFPVLAKFHESSLGDLKKIYFKSLIIMFGLGLLVLLGYIFVLPQVITLFLPEYLLSIKAVIILSLSIPFMFIQVPAVTVLLSTDKYLKSVLFLSIITVVFNISANFLFIPKFGYLAASWVTVASEVLSVVVVILFIQIKVFKK